MFECSRCGECCRNLDKSPIYEDLDRGDGTCRYLKNNDCEIYSDRPIICRIDEGYEVFFKNLMDYKSYLQLTYECCEILKQK